MAHMFQGWTLDLIPISGDVLIKGRSSRTDATVLPFLGLHPAGARYATTTVTADALDSLLEHGGPRENDSTAVGRPAGSPDALPRGAAVRKSEPRKVQRSSRAAPGSASGGRCHVLAGFGDAQRTNVAAGVASRPSASRSPECGSSGGGGPGAEQNLALNGLPALLSSHASLSDGPSFATLGGGGQVARAL